MKDKNLLKKDKLLTYKCFKDKNKCKLVKIL